MRHKVGGKKGKQLIYIVIPLILIFGFIYTNYDGTAITKWGVLLLDAIRDGNIRNYPARVLVEYGSATNYTLFVNAITAVWLCPAYLLCEFILHIDSLLVYEMWYKALLVLAVFLNVHVFGNVLEQLNFKKENIAIGKAFFMLSTITLVSALGKGQVDVYGLFFFLKAIEYQLKHDNIKMSLSMGIAFLVKPLVLWIIIPCYILLLGREHIRTIAYAGICLLPFALDKLVTIVIMPEYISLSGETAQMLKKEFGGLSMFESMFYGGINDTLPFWMIFIVVCFICYYIATHNMAEEWHFCVFPVVILVAFSIFCSVSYHWFIYVLPILIIMVLRLSKKTDGYLLMLGLNTSLACYFLVGELLILMPTLQGSVYGNMRDVKYFGMQILQQYRWILFPVFKTAFFTCILLILGVYVFERCHKAKTETREEDATGQDDGFCEKMLFVAQSFPPIAYILLTIIKYLI